MSHVLSDLLGAAEPSFTNKLRALEAESGHNGVDVVLVSDIARVLRQKLRELGLDPNDTTSLELYHALQSLLRQHDEFLRQAITKQRVATLNVLLPELIAKIDALTLPKSGWSLKLSVAKRLIKQFPPKKLMRLLKYRSVDSLLKRESVEKIFAGMQLVESVNWRRRFIARYKQLQASDFEDRPIKLFWLDEPALARVASERALANKPNMLLLQELCTVVVLPILSEPASGGLLLITAWILEAANQLRRFSSYFKLNQVKANFMQLLIKTLMTGELGGFKLGQRNFSWQDVYYYYGRPNGSALPEEFGLHVQPEDISLIDPHEVLYQLEPALSFWRGLRYVGMVADDRPVSLNLLDVALNAGNNLAYQQRLAPHLKTALWQELAARYLAQPSFERLLLDQFVGNNDSETWLQVGEMRV